MKLKLRHLLLAIVLLCGANAKACPVWLVGYVKIVDESGKVLKDAKIWRIYHAEDSFVRSKDRYLSVNSTDTDRYCFYSRGGYDFLDEDNFKKYYRVQCQGYTDVVIREIDFKNETRKLNGYPTLYIVMYRERFIQKGDFFIKLPQYTIEQAEARKDSSVLNMEQYSEKLLKEVIETTYERVLKSPYLSYPNPVKDKVTVEVKDSMPQPLKVKVCDLTGKVVFEAEQTESKLEYDLSDLSSGTYFISLETQAGVMKYCRRFLKE